MSERYHVRLEKERHVFSAAHFITYGDDVCEPLHGHNYRVGVEVHGPLEQNQYVVDFILLRDRLQEIVDALDHKMLLPTGHPTISVRAEGAEVVARHGERRWVFPAEECVLLPVENTTAERLAWYIGGRLRELLPVEAVAAIDRMRVAVDECDGQWGVCEFDGTA
ncbi:MAG: 6-pyruvoyl tetrahydropterin synthase family protein [Planctomycetota bacterium]